ncbi:MULTISPECIES: NAD(+) synthase [Mycobacterium avium complex (MAC)]|uniref:Glutamine-dependent NAD(+) synthetase n=5 Tax=Mycobacterium avium complex (MAC) TaxID=120793 RepID=A0AAW5S9X3_MYCBC|nr:MULTISPECIES: NAD(+) synthase [Mycobacterium avium complex (MAC)]ETA93127.1 NAD+ synthetase [Mycobacterium avium 05-4293]ETB26350.1 NAD+ synthetase [Mycobacterium avium 09-5983]ETB42509.1 NAD+ synthetase [Mycobacterium avium subsp. hominissuis 10-5606]ETB48484.1 NAD+ synthetase [Mycobacterium avium 11-0986]EUA36011.1 glutamine-dependent NAD(+) synthetase [Mycobacterium avium subsp. avium 2285 (R)]TXA41180.1 NAD(+) synthase [Mycobacterium tuberculosis variant bovis]
MDFYNAYSQGFARVAACTHRTVIGDPAANAESVLRLARACHDDSAALAVFPELTLSGYSIEDIVLQDLLLDDVEQAIAAIVAASADLLPVLVVGAPVRHRHRIYNAALVIHRGALLGVVPKSYLPTYREFYERRQIAPGDDERGTVRVAGLEAPFGPDLLFAASDLPGFVLHVEICEDMFVPIPPSAQAALAGATVLANLSGSPITIGRAEDRCLLARSASSRCLAAYVYSAAGEGESTTDLAWDGQTMVWENGVLLAMSERFPKGERRSIADIDTELLRSERLRMGTFDDNRRHHRIASESFRRIEFRLDPPAGDIGLRREIERFPFVPADRERLQQDCFEAYNIQVAGLEQRLRALDYPKLVIGISGGLDSTHALIVAARAMDREQRPRSDILAFTLPGFATGDRTKRNAIELCRALGVTFSEIDIRETAQLMLKEMDHPFARGEKVYDVTFENVQAGLRTDYLFRLANQRGGIVLGTGDLSELGLGWSTYGVGDQMSHYNVNAGVPKTLIQHLIRWVISSEEFAPEVGAVLQSVLDTEITPELVPSGEEEELQSSEAKVGPFALQDFSLFHVLRYGFRPSKIAFLAWHAWSDPEQGNWPPGFPEDKRPSYSLKEIRHWLQVFVQRFYSFSQFKRSALPNGPKVSHGGALSPRGDWRAPSDMSARIWLDEIEREVPED